MIEFKKKIKCSIYANGWNDTDEYSTSEIKTNKIWTNGKPIYRKVLLCTTATQIVSDQWNEIPGFSVADTTIDEYISMEYVGKYLNNIGSEILTNKKMTFVTFEFYYTVQVGDKLIIEYTKTTD